MMQSGSIAHTLWTWKRPHTVHAHHSNLILSKHHKPTGYMCVCQPRQCFCFFLSLASDLPRTGCNSIHHPPWQRFSHEWTLSGVLCTPVAEVAEQMYRSPCMLFLAGTVSTTLRLPFGALNFSMGSITPLQCQFWPLGNKRLSAATSCIWGSTKW